MKKLILTSILLLGISSIWAQKIEITPQYGYQVGSRYDYRNGYLKLNSSSQFGFTANFDINKQGTQAEFFWVQQNSALRIKDVFNYPHETFLTDMKVNHFQFGAIHIFDDGNLQPFAGMSVGFSVFSPDDSYYDDSTRFTVGFSGGIKYFFTDVIGVRLQTQLLMPIEWGGVYIYPGGSSVSVGGTLLQLNFSGGLIFAFGK